MKKKLAAIPLVTALAITPLTSVFGESNEVNASSSSQISSYSESNVTENNEIYTKEYDSELGQFYLLNNETNEKIYQAFESDIDGNPIKISLDDYKTLLESTETVNTNSSSNINIGPPLLKSPLYTTVYRYGGQVGSSVVNGAAKKVTQDFKGPAKLTYGESVTISNSFSGTYAAQVEGAIKSTATFGWNTSLTTISQFSVTYDIPKGKTGYIKFTPYLNKTWGKVYIDTRNTANVTISTQDGGTATGYSPKKTSNGKADGVFAIVIK